MNEAKKFFLMHEDCPGHDIWSFEETKEGYIAIQADEAGQVWQKLAMDGNHNIRVYRPDQLGQFVLYTEIQNGLIFDLLPFVLLAHRASGRLLGKCTFTEEKAPEVLYG